MNELIDYFTNASLSDIVIGIIVVAIVVRIVYEIITNK